MTRENTGHSAGGHLALWLAARRRLPADSPLWSATPLAIAHIVACGALPDLEAVAASPDNGCGIDVIRNLVGMPGSDGRDVYADTSIAPLLACRTIRAWCHASSHTVPGVVFAEIGVRSVPFTMKI